MAIQPKDSSGGKRQGRALSTRNAQDMLEKLPPDYIPHKVIALNLYAMFCINWGIWAISSLQNAIFAILDTQECVFLASVNVACDVVHCRVAVGSGSFVML